MNDTTEPGEKLPGKLSKVPEVVKQMREVVNGIKEKTASAMHELSRYQYAPAPRKQTMEMMLGRLEEEATRYEARVLAPKILEFASYSARQQMGGGGLLTPRIDGLLVESSGGSSRVCPGVVAWILHNLLSDKICQVAKDTKWPGGFDDGVSSVDRDKKIESINAEISALKAERDAIQDELASVGSTFSNPAG